MKFLVSKLKDLGLPSEIDPEDGTIISNEIVDRSRWSIHYDLTFRLTGMPEDQAWIVGYSRGATESQDERPWQDQDEVDATLVHKVEKIVSVWEAIT